MERRPSMTMRIRKLSNTIKNAIIPSSSNTTGQPSRTRRVSVEDIGKPKLQRQYSVDFYIAANGDRDAPHPHRQTRPSMDERPPVYRDPQAQAREQENHRRLKALMGSERPREEAHPHGAGGSRPKPPRAPHTSKASPSKKGAIPFPIGVDDIGPPMALAPREATHQRQTGESTTQSRSPPGPREALYTVFAPVRRTPSSLSTKTMPERTWAQDTAPSTTRMEKPSLTSREVVGRTAGGVAPEQMTSVYFAEGPATVGRKGAIRRTSKTSNAPLPSPDLYNLFGRSEETLVGTPRQSIAGLQRSQSAATHSTLRSTRPPHPGPSPLRPKPVEPRDVPHDIHERERTQSASSAGWPEGATERVVIAYGQTFGRHSRTERAQAQAGLDLRCLPAPQVAQLSAPDPHRASSFKAEVGHVAPGPSRPRRVEKEPEPKPEPAGESTKRERPGRTRDGKGKGTTHMTEEYVPFTRYFDEVALKNGLVNGVPEGPLPDLLPGEVPGAGVGAPATAPLRVQKKEREGKEREGEASRLRRVVETGKR